MIGALPVDLTPEQMRLAIREMARAVLGQGETRETVARRFGCSPSFVSMVCAGKRRRHDLIGTDVEQLVAVQ